MVTDQEWQNARFFASLCDHSFYYLLFVHRSKENSVFDKPETFVRGEKEKMTSFVGVVLLVLGSANRERCHFSDVLSCAQSCDKNLKKKKKLSKRLTHDQSSLNFDQQQY